MPGIERLHPHLQHAIVHDLGWRSLRPVQDLTIDAILDGCNSVVLAPTAGGKTEAAMFPLLSQVLSENTRPVAVLYVCPIRALLNNQEDRLRSYARMVGFDVFKWHGDVSDSKKKGFRAAPSHVLMTTPESLEVMMISARTDTRNLFQNLSALVIDEVHAFAGDDRGAHLASLLERLTELCGRDIQRIGLSATVGNPHVIGEWLQGSSKRPFRLVDPPKPSVQRDLHIEYCEDIGAAASGIAQIARGKKSLVFVESRSKAERVALALGGSSVEVFIHHSSVSRADRTLAEEQFARGENTAIVCTSTMELGIDVGDLDQVIQVDAPGSVASFLQRMGRTGRRSNTRANCTFFCLSPESLLQSLALLRLAESGWVEDVRPSSHAIHVLAHQVMALTLQEGGISRHRILPWLESAFPFSNIRAERLQELIDTMVERDILYEADHLLTLGKRGEKLYGKRNFFELYSVFTAPPVMHVQHGKEDVGYVQSLFVSMHDYNDGPLCFRLSGRAWEVGHIDWSKSILHVRPADHGRVPSWLGLPGTLSTRLCQTMMDVLINPKEDEAHWLSRIATLELASMRDSYAGVLEAGAAPLEDQPDGVTWHTFAGGAVNRLLAAGLEQASGRKWIAGNLSLRCKDSPITAAREAVVGLAGLDWEHMAAEAARGMARGTVSKFQPCLPEAAEDRLLAERLLDLAGTLRFLGSVTVDGKRLVLPPEAIRSNRAQAHTIASLDLHVTDAGEAISPSNSAVQWVDTPEALRVVGESLLREFAIALDVKTTIDFGTLCLIQVATAKCVYLVDPFAVGDLSPLASVLAAPRPIKFLRGVQLARRTLATVGVDLNGVTDADAEAGVASAVGESNAHVAPAASLEEEEFSRDSTVHMSDWARRPLSEGQLSNAVKGVRELIARK